jgi:hypothetical protein
MPKQLKIVRVNDKMQRGYRYVLTAPIGRNFDPEFRPELTPKEMLALGVFCGKYPEDQPSEVPRLYKPASWSPGFLGRAQPDTIPRREMCNKKGLRHAVIALSYRHYVAA